MSDKEYRNRNFFMGSRFITLPIMHKLAKDNPAAFNLYIHLSYCSNKFSMSCLSHKEIADYLGVSRRTVYRLLSYLSKKHHYIQIYKIGNENVYVLDPCLMWHAYADDRRKIGKALDFGGIVLYEKENKNLLKEFKKWRRESYAHLKDNDIRFKDIENKHKEQEIKERQSIGFNAHWTQLLRNILLSQLTGLSLSKKQFQVGKFIVLKMNLNNNQLNMTGHEIASSINKSIGKISYVTTSKGLKVLAQNNFIVHTRKRISITPSYLEKAIKEIQNMSIFKKSNIKLSLSNKSELGKLNKSI